MIENMGRPDRTPDEPSSHIARPLFTALALLVLLSASCSDEVARAPRPAEPQPGGGGGQRRAPGGCHNINATGSCEFIALNAIAPNVAPGAEGTTLYAVRHRLTTANNEHVLETHLRAPTDRQIELESFYQSHSPVPCSAYIVSPPCNPQGTTVQLDLEPPSFATPERF